ncbi:hypothetical protein V5E97_33065 [Singulisphaera sp. Ch08]|uniref:Uncharacterized protein n=1 Tax=Singulisphaera sp. Ch08 TaxID=3120278 RepID=A0AAU7CD43_9BACT
MERERRGRRRSGNRHCLRRERLLLDDIILRTYHAFLGLRQTFYLEAQGREQALVERQWKHVPSSRGPVWVGRVGTVMVLLLRPRVMTHHEIALQYVIHDDALVLL